MDEEREPKLFTLTEAERVRLQVEPLLVEAVEARRRMSELEEALGEIATRVQLMGGIQVPLEKAVRLRYERDGLAQSINERLERIHETGCQVKDLDMGLLDFPAILNNEEVLLCWRLGEERIRFWHRPHEGFAGRKPLDPAAPDAEPPVQ